MIAADKVYPGDAYVDLIGLDVYNQSPDLDITPQGRWSYLMNQSFGLKWHANFGGGHRKWISFPE
jgi:beta-mannanase